MLIEMLCVQRHAFQLRCNQGVAAVNWGEFRRVAGKVSDQMADRRRPNSEAAPLTTSFARLVFRMAGRMSRLQGQKGGKQHFLTCFSLKTK